MFKNKGFFDKFMIKNYRDFNTSKKIGLDLGLEGAELVEAHRNLKEGYRYVFEHLNIYNLDSSTIIISQEEDLESSWEDRKIKISGPEQEINKITNQLQEKGAKLEEIL